VFKAKSRFSLHLRILLAFIIQSITLKKDGKPHKYRGKIKTPTPRLICPQN